MDTIAFGNRVRAARELLGITQEDLASRVGMSPSHMSIVERGVKVPRMDTVVDYYLKWIPAVIPGWFGIIVQTQDHEDSRAYTFSPPSSLSAQTKVFGLPT